MSKIVWRGSQVRTFGDRDNIRILKRTRKMTNSKEMIKKSRSLRRVQRNCFCKPQKASRQHHQNLYTNVLDTYLFRTQKLQGSATRDLTRNAPLRLRPHDATNSAQTQLSQNQACLLFMKKNVHNIQMKNKNMNKKIKICY